MSLKIKIICGHRLDQEYSVDINEAHKAYHLFFNPDQRAIFSDGLAVEGADIRRIVPDYHATMGWNPTHKIDSDDMNELRGKGIDRQLQAAMGFAKQVAKIGDPQDLRVPLVALKEKHHALLDGQTARIHTGGESVKKLLQGRTNPPTV